MGSNDGLQRVYPALRYRDAHAAIRWLEKVLGFDAAAVYPGEDNAVAHAQLAFEGGLVMLGSATPNVDVGAVGVYLVTDDVDAVHARATSAGAEFVQELAEMDYGGREFTVRDPEGNSWSVGTYQPALDSGSG